MFEIEGYRLLKFEEKRYHLCRWMPHRIIRSYIWRCLIELTLLNRRVWIRTINCSIVDSCTLHVSFIYMKYNVNLIWTYEYSYDTLVYHKYIYLIHIHIDIHHLRRSTRSTCVSLFLIRIVLNFVKKSLLKFN